jgi:hypothetical protein
MKQFKDAERKPSSEENSAAGGFFHKASALIGHALKWSWMQLL